MKLALGPAATEPVMFRLVASLSAKLLALKLPSAAIWLLPVSVAAPTALPVSVAAFSAPPDWLIAPAEVRSRMFVALTLPANVMAPVRVASASVLATPVSVTGPPTSNDLLFTSAKPAVVLNAPSVPTRLVGLRQAGRGCRAACQRAGDKGPAGLDYRTGG